MSIKRLFCLVALMTMGKLLSAQNATPYTYLNNLVQPAPNAAGLGKYADYPVSYYTGVPNVSVPLYDLKEGGVSLPISLSYHASGIRVSELATWVGLGWVLNAGGMITRTVKGSPDEGTHKSSPGCAGPRGYYADYGLSTFPTLPYPVNGASNDPTNYFANTVSNAVNQQLLDTEPDLYTFNFNGYTGKFVFDENRKARLLENDNLKIIPNYSSGNFNSWTIITPDGIKYIFGENGAHEVTDPTSSVSPHDLDSWAPSTWVLTHIINPNTKDTVSFTYVSELYGYHDLGSETSLFIQGPSQWSSLLEVFSSPAALQSACDVSGIQINGLSTTITGLRLTTIQTKNYTVKFIANNIRADLIQYTAPATKTYSLDSIKIYNNANQCIKQFALSHSYFTSTHNTASAVFGYLSQRDNDSSDMKRLKLTSVTEYSGDGSIKKPPYKFYYNETFQMPRRLSYDQDHWGYCNNWQGDINPYFTPPTSDGLCNISGAGANRNPVWPYMAAFSLTSIKGSLGDSTAFIYESNSATNTTSGVGPVGGLRIKQIKVIDNVTGKAQIRSFDYNNSGVLFQNPKYLLRLDNEYYWDTMTGNSTGVVGYKGNTFAWLVWGILRQSQSIVPLQNPQGNHIGYSYVKETFGPNGEGGYTIHQYSMDALTDSLDSRLNVSNYTSMGIEHTDSLGNPYPRLYGNGHFNDFTADPLMLPQNLQYNHSYQGNMFYPFAPQQIDLRRGKLLSEQTYNSTGGLLQSIDNVYQATYDESVPIRGFECYQTVTNTGMASITWNAYTYYKLHTGVSHLRSTTKKIYSGSNYTTQLINYGYESPYHNLKTSDTTTDSQGNTLINKNYYSLDYANTATSDNVFGKMKARNLLEPVRSDSWRNGSLVGEKITKYYDFATSSTDTLINTANVYSLEASTSLTPAQSSESLSWTAPVSTLIPNTTYLVSKVNLTYDGNTGKLINQQLTADKSQGIVWNSQLGLPIALVDNAKNTSSLKEFYYEGFEESTASGLYTGNAHTGTKSVFAPYTVTWTPPPGRSYVITYWYFSGGVWQLQREQTFTGSLALTGGTAYDDIRIHPSDANMTNYTYDAVGNLTSSMDAKGLTNYYEYDSFQRLKNIRDKDKNIVKSFCYNYAGLANGCYIMLPTYTNVVKYGSATRSCSSGYTGTLPSPGYTVPAGTYISNISQDDADNQALADITANGQTYANIYGNCIVNANMTLINNTGAGYKISFTAGPANYVYDMNGGTIQVPVGTYSVSIYPTGAYVNHTISLTGYTASPPPPAPRADFSSVVISTGTTLTAKVQ